ALATERARSEAAAREALSDQMATEASRARDTEKVLGRALEVAEAAREAAASEVIAERARAKEIEAALTRALEAASGGRDRTGQAPAQSPASRRSRPRPGNQA
ncbi:MAG: hypothetical protein ACRD0J_00380, partial [Acidimicrobiales bacterium]